MDSQALALKRKHRDKRQARQQGEWFAAEVARRRLALRPDPEAPTQPLEDEQDPFAAIPPQPIAAR